MKTLGRWRLAEAQAGPICNQLLLVLADTDIWAEFEPPKNSKQINNLVYPNSNFRREKSRSSKFLFTASIEVIVRNLRIELISERFHDSISKNNSIYMGAFFRYESPGWYYEANHPVTLAESAATLVEKLCGFIRAFWSIDQILDWSNWNWNSFLVNLFLVFKSTTFSSSCSWATEKQRTRLLLKGLETYQN